MGFEQEESFDIPYEPTVEERPLLADALRWELMKELELEYIVRFNGKEHYRSPVPYGEELLRHVHFEHCGTFGGYKWFRASIHLPCPAPTGGTRENDPFDATVELRLPNGRWQADMPYEDDDHLPPFDGHRTREHRDKQIATIIFMTAALIVGGIVGESQWGTITAMRKKFNAWYGTADNVTAPEKRGEPDVRDTATTRRR